MASFEKAFDKIQGIEFSSRYNLLHKNKKETGYTFYGIYQTAHPTLPLWDIVKSSLERTRDLRTTSYELSFNNNVIDIVKEFYKTMFWDKLNLDLVDSQKIAEEMFIFYFNTGNKKQTVKMAQLISGAYPDGKLGPNTLESFRKTDDSEFDRMYDKLEEKYYRNLVRLHPRLTWALKGLINRAYKI